MTDMMQTCWNWMMSFGVVGLLVGVVLVALLFALLVSLIRRMQ